MRKILLFIFIVTGLNTFAQDPHFSQFYASPLTLNPAFAGKFDGIVRVGGNYRNQWPTINRAFNTTTLAVDFPIMQNSIGMNDTWGVGIKGFSGQSANCAVKFNYASVGTAFHKGLDEDGYHQVGVGFQATYANMLINVSSLKFADQLTPSGFTGTTDELFTNTSLQNNYVDVNAGILYNGSTTDRNNFYAGISMYHLNRPKQQFTGTYFILNPRVTFHGGTYFPAGESSTIHISGLYSTQGKATETLIGGAYQFTVANDTEYPTSFYVGSWMRFNDAVIPYVGLEYRSLRFGLTYDSNTSSLKTASNGRGGIELSLIYIKKAPESRGISCPKF